MKAKRKVFWFDGRCSDINRPVNPNTHWNFKNPSVAKDSKSYNLDDNRLAKHINEILKPFLPSLANARKRRNKLKRLQKKSA